MRDSQEERLRRLMRRYGIAEFDYAAPDGQIRIVLADAGSVEGAFRASGPARFTRRHPSVNPVTDDGMVAIDPEIAGFLTVGPLVRPIMAPRSGRAFRIVAEEGSIVGYGDPLIIL
ncbi:hypothetical protein [Rhizobium alvei]|uniref:Biotin carboxyl carrier protein n=1 Tax=Rhizobium alvei TaxID=1132659 RepID=A0ABT8YSG2_9HYPH|nr:hypothetical protein [Rhizobium alvei]MDO6966264.1 hypothetical protein [Rhizobium alvei]